MKSILMSIKPKYCALIERGEKTIEVRKTRPKIETPFKVYMYCTKEKNDTFFTTQHFATYSIAYVGNGKVIGEFVCDMVEKIMPDSEYYSYGYNIDDDMMPEICLTRKELCDYGNGKHLYGLHISDLKIYDNSKELSEFKVLKKSPKGCGCIYLEYESYISRPPQSWCYVEENVDGTR